MVIVTREHPPFELRMEGVTKHFPGVTALDAVDLQLHGGTITGLAGENGSGKSSLMKVLAGQYQPDRGRVLIGGQPVDLGSTAAAVVQGVAMVAQEILVHPRLSVAENLFGGDLPRTRLGLVDHRRIHREGTELLDRYELGVGLDAALSTVSLRTQQMIAILKMARRKPRVLILDEPTSSLGAREIRNLYQLIEDLRALGTAVVYITHRLGEYFDLCSTVTVLRDGSVTGTLPVSDLDEPRLIKLMLGRAVSLEPNAAPKPRAGLRPRLEVRDLGVTNKLRDVTFDVMAGEVVGIAGQAGSGRSTLVKCLFGLVSHSGTVRLDGEELETLNVRKAMASGIAFVPEDRRRSGLVMTMSVADNLTITRWREMSRLGVLGAKSKRQVCGSAIATMGIRTPTAETMVRNLSGGNQQKIVISKWLATNPKLLILDEPTRGIDVGAKGEIYDIVRMLTAQGLAVLIVSSEMQELRHLCDRIVTMHRGAVAGIVPVDAASEELITALSFGTELQEVADVGR